MELEIQIIRDPCRDSAKQRVRVFGESGGTIGRAPGNYWALPDPHAYVSGQHCEVEYRGDAFWLRDTSRNGVFVNDATERVGYGHRVRLGDGDRLRLGLYELLVRFRDHGRLVGSVQHDDGIDPGISRSADQAGRTATLSANQMNDVVLQHAPLAGALPVENIEVAAQAPAAASEGAAQRATAAEAPGLLPLSDTGSHRLVKIDRARLRAIGLLPPESQERLVANQFRQIKRSLLANAFGKGVVPAVPNGRLLMLTSSLPGEGKTFSTLNLALSMAREKDIETLVVDADVAKPQVSGLFNMAKAPGLLEALTDDSIDVESLVLRTDVNGLFFLPAGRCEGDIATELLASARMEATLLRLGSRSTSRIIIFDSPPLLLTNEARVLASIVGQILLVVRAGVTPQQAVLEAIGFVEEGKPIGLLLNQTRAAAPGSYYGYGAYGYGAYGLDKDESRNG